MEAVRHVLRESGEPMRARDVVARVIERGWVNPEASDPGAAIRIVIRRLAEKGEAKKVRTGVYEEPVCTSTSRPSMRPRTETGSEPTKEGIE